MYGFDTFDNDYAFSSAMGSKEKEKEKEVRTPGGEAWWSLASSGGGIQGHPTRRRTALLPCTAKLPAWCEDTEQLKRRPTKPQEPPSLTVCRWIVCLGSTDVFHVWTSVDLGWSSEWTLLEDQTLVILGSTALLEQMWRTRLHGVQAQQTRIPQ